MSLCLEKRGIEQLTKYIDKDRLMLQFILPLNEIIIDFHDALKSLSSGYASFDYEDNGYQRTDIVKVLIFNFKVLIIIKITKKLCLSFLFIINHYYSVNLTIYHFFS